MGIGAFSVAESLTEGTTLLTRRLRLLAPFILAALLFVLPVEIMVAICEGAFPPYWVEMYAAPLIFLLEFPSTLIRAWATWLVIRRYAEEGMVELTGAPDMKYIKRLRDFLSHENPVLRSLIGLGLIIASISVAGRVLRYVLYFLGGGVIGFYGAWPILWVVGLVISFAIFGVLICGRSARGAISLSRDIVSLNLLPTVALVVGLMVITYIVSWAFNWLIFPLLSLVVGMAGGLPRTATIMSAGLWTFPASGIADAINASCLCYAFLSAFGRINKIAVAVKHGKAIETCPGSPRVPGCEKCRELQDFGDKLYCTRFGKTIRRP